MDESYVWKQIHAHNMNCFCKQFSEKEKTDSGNFFTKNRVVEKHYIVMGNSIKSKFKWRKVLLKKLKCLPIYCMNDPICSFITTIITEMKKCNWYVFWTSDIFLNVCFWDNALKFGQKSHTEHKDKLLSVSCKND